MSFQESFGLSLDQTVEVIGVGRRLVAYIIDAVILWVVQIGLLFCAGFAIGAASGGEISQGVSLALNCVSLLISVAYFVAFWATTGQTPGKMALGIKVIGVDGQPVSWGKAFLRYIGYIISGLVLSIGFIWAAFDAKRQGWHDKIAKTYVVAKETQFSGEGVTIVPSDQGSSLPIILLVIYIVGLILIPIIVIAILLLLGPVIGNVFSNIVINLETPTP